MSVTSVAVAPGAMAQAVSEVPSHGAQERSLRAASAVASYTDEELDAAVGQALDQHWVDGLARVRTWGATLAFIGMGLAILPLTLIPQLQGLWRVGLGTITFAILPVLAAAGAAMLVWQRYDRFDRRHLLMIYAEGVATMIAGIALIYASGSAGSVFWLVIVAQLLNVAQRPRIRRFAFWLEGLGLGTLALLFVASGQWWDGLAVVFLASICLWLLWIILDGQIAIVRGIAERSLLEKKFQDIVVTRERERIARDLHDGMGAELTGLILRARSLDDEALGENQRARIEAFVTQARDNLEELRTVVWSLQHEGMDLSQLIGRLERKCQVLCPSSVAFALVEKGCASALSIPLEWAPHVQRIAQEAVRNAVSHGAPSRVTLTIGLEGDGLRIEVLDDGRGLSAGDITASTGGLSNMHKRAAALGGTLAIEDAAPGVRIVLMLRTPR